MQLGPQGREYVRFVEVIGRGNDDRVEFVAVEQLLEIGEHVGHVEAIGQRTRFGRIVIAQRDQLGAAQLGQNWDVRQLGNRTRADDGYTHAVFHSRLRR